MNEYANLIINLALVAISRQASHARQEAARRLLDSLRPPQPQPWEEVKIGETGNNPLPWPEEARAIIGPDIREF